MQNRAKKEKGEKVLKEGTKGSSVESSGQPPKKGVDMAAIAAQMRVKGVHFDLNGEKWTLEQLTALGGLFEFRDVWDRLTQPKKRVERWIQTVTWPGIFYRVPTSATRSTCYIDITKFQKQVEAILSAGKDAFLDDDD